MDDLLAEKRDVDSRLSSIPPMPVR